MRSPRDLPGVAHALSWVAAGLAALVALNAALGSEGEAVTRVLAFCLAVLPPAALWGLRARSHVLLFGFASLFVVVAFALVPRVGSANALIGVPLVLLSVFLGLAAPRAVGPPVRQDEHSPTLEIMKEQE